MKPPGECNKRALEPPYRPLTSQPANRLKGHRTTKATGCSDLPRRQVPRRQQKSLDVNNTGRKLFLSSPPWELTSPSRFTQAELLAPLPLLHWSQQAGQNSNWEF
ncbi:hypothetical protein EYF80_011349 [Liparis tanakae]|uniref:Uncharacterized protein n=1 Tax=Liparis tanakae TaxID=230148 RepID=A0A4Z2IKM6_9TELE|nr:hypothetical protein EYF80_011349 [Liparis tanakae]